MLRSQWIGRSGGTNLDAEREQAVAWLQSHLLSGRLTLEEFSHRVDEAYAARVRSDLERIRSGLPSTHEPPAARSQQRANRFTGAIFGKVVKRGRLKLRRWTVAGGAFCDVDLDLRKAEIHGQRTALTVLVGFGNVDVYVPEHVSVTVSGLTLFGHRREWGEEVDLPHSPEISVRAISLLAPSMCGESRPRWSATTGRSFVSLQRRQQELPRQQRRANQSTDFRFGLAASLSCDCCLARERVPGRGSAVALPRVSATGRGRRWRASSVRAWRGWWR